MRSVDVVIPCYNYARFLEYCVDTVLTQRDVDVRVLIVDDCSTDDSESVGRRLAARHTTVEYRRHTVNRGHIATFNEGIIDWARRDYLLLLSADDGLLPGGLSSAVDALEAHPRAAFCHGAAVVGEHPPAHPPDGGGQRPRVLTGTEFWRGLYQLAANPIHTPTAVVRTVCQHAIGGYRPEFHHTSDLHMWLQLATVGDVCELLEPIAFKRDHPQNMSSGYNAIPLEDPQQVAAAFQDVFQLAGRVGLEDSGLLDEAFRTIAERIFWEGSRALERGDGAYADRCAEVACRMHADIARMPEYRRFEWKRRLRPVTAPLARLAERLRKGAKR